MDQLRKAFHYSTRRLRTISLWVLIPLATLSIAANADQLSTPTAGYLLELSTGRIEGTDLLAGAEGVYYKFTGGPTPSSAPSPQPNTVTTQGSTLRINDDNTELYFQRINPRTETKISISHSELLYGDVELERSIFFSKSSVSYAFQRGIGVLIDPARLDYFSAQVGGEVELTKIFQAHPVGEVRLSIKSGVARKISKTRLYSALIDVSFSDARWLTHYGLSGSIRPIKDLPLEMRLGLQRDSARGYAATVNATYAFRF